jgi:hypothetical protein
MDRLLALLRQRFYTIWTGYALAFIFGAAIPVTNYLTLQSAMQRLRVIVMDSRDTFYLSSAGSFETSKHIHAELARLAADTIFSRNPDGFDAPERLERLFNPFCTEKLKKEAALDAEVYRSQQIHQKFEAGTIREINVAPDAVLVSVEGQVLRSGNFSGRLINEAKHATLFLKLRVNDDMAFNGRYPLVVVDEETKFN